MLAGARKHLHVVFRELEAQPRSGFYVHFSGWRLRWRGWVCKRRQESEVSDTRLVDLKDEAGRPQAGIVGQRFHQSCLRFKSVSTNGLFLPFFLLQNVETKLHVRVSAQNYLNGNDYPV